MTLNDARRVAEIHVHAWQVAYKGILPTEILDNINLEERVAMWTNKLIPQSNRDNLVLEDDNIIWGWAAHGKCRDHDKDSVITKDLYGIYVSPERFRHGYGRLLWNETFTRLIS